MCSHVTMLSVGTEYKEASPTHVSMYHKEVGLAVLAPEGHRAMGIQRLMLGALALKGIRVVGSGEGLRPSLAVLAPDRGHTAMGKDEARDQFVLTDRLDECERCVF